MSVARSTSSPPPSNASPIVALRSGVQHYAWGSPTLMAKRFGWRVDGTPQAELWIGAHPSLPSSVEIDGSWRRLDEVIAADPVHWLGAETLRRFGPTLPMLLKVLGIAAPLSIQAHPSPEQAAAGFAREDAEGIARDASERSYRDPRAKPEMICALTDMRVLCGFRALDETRERFRRIGGPVAALGELLVDDGAIATVVGRVLGLRGPELHEAVGRAETAVQGGSVLDKDVIGDLARRYPDDPGVIVALMLNVIELHPDEALFLPAGNMHAYLSGLGVEVMANSDNVLRGGLTPKHVDVDELVSVLDPVAGPWPLTPSVAAGTHPGIVRRKSTSPEVDLWTVVFGEYGGIHSDEPMKNRAKIEVTLPASQGPTLLLVTEGFPVFYDGVANFLELKAGDSAYLLPGANVTVVGSGRLWLARARLD
jgi:mannose-6-phosphate isomerase